MTYQQATEAAQKAWSEAEDRRQEINMHSRLLKKNYERLLRQVQAWEAPSKDHVELKSFMFEQLHTSLHFDIHSMSAPEPITVDSWLICQIRKAANNIEHYSSLIEKEKQRTEAANRWFNQLRESLPR